MRRILALSLSASLVCVLGCGTDSYNRRLEHTLNDLKYRQRLDQYLSPPAQDQFQGLAIFLRPPKPLVPSKEFQLPTTPGLFDLTTSFYDPASKPKSPGLRLHVLARRKVKKAPPKKGAPPPEPEVPRGDFRQDVQVLLASELGATEENFLKFQDMTAKNKTAFKRLTFTSPILNNDQIRVFLYTNKRDNYDVALIWDIPPGVEKTPPVTEGQELTLGSFATGAKASQQFANGASEDEAAPGAVGASAPTAF
ncbi:MAG: hypothetical protein ABI353_00685 [Isosphaeraceae bacterium]